MRINKRAVAPFADGRFGGIKNLALQVGGIFAPFVDEGIEVGGEFAVEVHLLSRDGVDKAQCFGVKCLPRAQLETILYELIVAGGFIASQHLVAAITLVAEQRVADVFQVHANLVGASCLELALH